MGHEHGFTSGHHGEGLPPVVQVFGLLACLLVLGILLIRNDAVRARLVAMWELMSKRSTVAAALGQWRSPDRSPPDAGRTSARGPAASVPVDARPQRPDPAAIAAFPADLREVLRRTDELAAGLTVPAADATWPARALAEHRLETLRAALVELVDTFVQIPPDVAVQLAAYSDTSPLQDALAAAGLLEQEARNLQSEVFAGLAAKLRRQRAFLADKYRPTEEPSTLHLP